MDWDLVEKNQDPDPVNLRPYIPCLMLTLSCQSSHLPTHQPTFIYSSSSANLVMHIILLINQPPYISCPMHTLFYPSTST